MAGLLALAGFSCSQKIQLAWYALNEPGDDLHYLEIVCASDKAADIQIFYNTTIGINQQDNLTWPLPPTAQTYTYTYPLPDAPITELRLDPVAAGGAMTVRNLRIIDRRGAEVRRFTKDDILPVQQIASISALVDGWKITSVEGSNDPFANIRLPAPIIAKGINHRNLLRCLLSGGYLALMLWILLLAVLFTFYRPTGWKDAFRHMAFMAALALMFSAVGNRGLIKNSIRYARFTPPPLPAPAVTLDIDIATDRPTNAQLFWDTGRGFNEADSARAYYEPHNGLQTLRFSLPLSAPLKALRFDPLDDEANFTIRGLRVVDSVRRTLAVLPPQSIEATQDISSFTIDDDIVNVRTTPGRKDPIISFTPTAVAEVNRAVQALSKP